MFAQNEVRVGCARLRARASAHVGDGLLRLVPLGRVVFPEDDLCCFRCPLMGIELKVDREYCKLTGEYLVAPRDLVGFKCPLVFEQEEEEHG